MTLSLAGLFLSLAALMFLCFKRINIIIASLVCCVILALTSGLPWLETLQTDYLSGYGGYIASNFLIFAFSAMFGKVMDVTGASTAFAKLITRACGEKYAIYGAMLATALLAYGGVSIFVIAFTVYPIFLNVFQQANLPRRLIPAAILAAAVTFACNMIPGSPQLSNILPTQYLGTTAMAAPLLACIAAVVMIAMIVVYFEWEIRRCRARGEGFEATPEVLERIQRYNTADSVNSWLSIIPVAVLIAVLNVLKQDIIVAGFCGIVVAMALFWKNIEGGFVGGKMKALSLGLGDAITSIMNTSAVVAFGGVVKLTDGFQTFVDWITTFSGPPLLSFGLATTCISGITGSGTGGISLAMEIFAENFLAMGVNPEALHRVASIAAGGLDSLPHNGLIVTTLVLCGMTHKEGYRPVFITTVLMPLAMMFVAAVLGGVLYPMA